MKNIIIGTAGFFIDMKTIFDDDIEELSENIERVFLERGIK